MSAQRGDLRLRALTAAFAAAGAVAAASAACAQAPAAVYDIPSQSLDQALEQLARRSGYHVNYEEMLAQGVVSHEVRGAASPREALNQMLAGTGLAARFTRKDAFTIVPQSAQQRPDLRLDDLVVTAPVIGEARAEDYGWYGSLLLEECFRRLRGQASLKGRRYELQLYVWLDSTGVVTRLQSLGPDEEVETRRLVESMLSGLRLASLPPQAMPQPIRLRISAM